MKKFIYTLALILMLCSPGYAKNADNYLIGYLNLPFWQNFNDDVLIKNLTTVYQNNNDLKASSLKVKEAQRLVKISLANQLPYVGFDGYIGRIFHSSDEVFGKLTIPDYTETRFLLPLSYSYEIDIYGKNYLRTKSQKKRFEMTKQEEKSAYIYLTSAFATDYYNLIKADKLIALQKDLITTQKQVIGAVEKKYELGTANINDLIQEKKALTNYKEELDNLLEKQDVLKNQISVLLADRSFSQVDRTDYDNVKAKIVVPEAIQTDVILKRPDCVKSELNLEKIGIDVRVAKRELLPSFNIVGTLGFNAYNLSSSDKFLANLALAPTWDLFTGGRKIQMLKLQKYEYEIAIQNYDKTILRSIQETNDALYTLKSTAKRHSIVEERLNLSEQDMTLEEQKIQVGVSDLLDILYKKEIELIIQKQEASLKINEIIAMINLYQALGGVDFFSNSL